MLLAARFGALVKSGGPFVCALATSVALVSHVDAAMKFRVDGNYCTELADNVFFEAAPTGLRSDFAMTCSIPLGSDIVLLDPASSEALNRVVIRAKQWTSATRTVRGSLWVHDVDAALQCECDRDESTGGFGHFEIRLELLGDDDSAGCITDIPCQPGTTPDDTWAATAEVIPDINNLTRVEVKSVFLGTL
jgi:hypothetical protein